MTSPKHLAIAALAAFVLASCSPAATWTEYVYKPQHFAAAFTAPPKVTAGDGPYLVEENDGSVDFGVTAACNIVTDKSADQMMADAVAATGLNGTVRDLTYTAIGQTMGREMLVDRAGATTVKQRIFVKGGCMYLVFASASGGPEDEQVTHFLDSFRLL